MTWSQKLFRETRVLRNIKVKEVRPNIAYFTMPRKSAWVKKRRSETAKAASQQENRRKNIIIKRAAEYSLECKANILVAIQIRKTVRSLSLFASEDGLGPACLIKTRSVALKPGS
jgi:hypothetical protein